ncbi:transcription factor [Salvia divinorum]|uniref:Transcription factor n=1 Tax=Salvia divinorum TaxID=28513 RepID=A0ABD1H583_SALDI
MKTKEMKNAVENHTCSDQDEARNNAVAAEEDNEEMLRKITSGNDEEGAELGGVEVRFEDLTVEADCFVGERALPTLPNAARNIAEAALSCFGVKLAERAKLHILKHTSGIIKPSRMTLLLGPPSCGKTTLLLALAGRLSSTSKASGVVTYNGHKLCEFVPQKTAAYVGQNDVHVAEMTVGETLGFSAKCQGVGSRYDFLKEIARSENEDGSSDITDYVLKILGLEECRDTIVGDQMLRGISGGQKKRLTTGEMIVGPSKVMFMDEISTGLDSSTTFQVVKCMQQIAHHTEATILMSLLQPDPETFNLFDDIILLSEGHTVYHGPRQHVLEFFRVNGFECPQRKGVADFLQEVTSKKDQEQYWADATTLYRYVSVSDFAERFKHFLVGVQLHQELSVPFDRSRSPKSALVYDKSLVPRRVLLEANFAKEWLLIKRNSFVYVTKTVQIVVVALIASTVFLRTGMHAGSEEDGAVYMGVLVFGMIINTFNGYVEISLTIQRLPVFYKQRDLLFHPTWAFAIPHLLLRIPISLFESFVWTATTYYTIGFAPQVSRFLKQLLWVFCIQQMAAGMFRLIAGICRTMVISKTGGSLTLLLVFLLGGFIVPLDKIPIWWRWGYWISPLSYGYNSVAVNEMFASRWMDKLASDNVTRLGVSVLKQFDVFQDEKWYWIGIGALLVFTAIFNILFVIALMHLNSFKKPQGIISQEQATTEGIYQEKTDKDVPKHTPCDSMDSLFQSRSTTDADKRGMVLPFTPLAMSFEDVNYYVDMPPVMQEKGAAEGKLQLLHELTGSFRPGVLTALMGVSGAGKTTLMDVLSGRKTRGYIEGDIRISGFPKKQETFARISGYCEQNDIHSPQVTVHESLMYSAFLRLPRDVSNHEKMIFVSKVMRLVELDNLKDAIVGIPGVTGLSTEQRKRLTIAVELVANPSIIFMDEPTSGLDARAAAIIMRTVRNTVDTGRTVVCTIHQPGIDLFEAFDELLLMKRGGRVIYAGPLGQQSRNVVDYFEAVPGVPKIEEQRNPAAWMLEVSSDATETRLGIDFGDYYKSSSLYQQNKALVKDLQNPPQNSKDLHFPSQYSQSTLSQFKLILWKQKWTYWRNPNYNLSRFFFTLAAALLIGSIFWRVGTKRENSNDLTTVIGAMYAAALFLGINNCAMVQPAVAIERTVFYRERAAGMYSVLPYAMAQVITEIPYVFVQTTYYTLIVYSMVRFEWEPTKFLWFFFVNFFSFLYFTYYGMMTVSATPNIHLAAVFSNAFYYVFNLFSGFFIPGPNIPTWWIWYYWICPMAWTVYGLIVSQYGDVEDETRVEVTGLKTSVRSYIEEHFGYKLDFMGEVGVVLVGFTVFFAFMYAYCLKTLNFQKR